MDILHATRTAARVTRLQAHLQQLLRTTAASWGLEPPSSPTVLRSVRLIAPCALPPACKTAPAARA